MTRIDRGRLVAAALLCIFALLGLTGCSSEPEQPSNLILISVDTLRADYLGAYGNVWVQTPNLDQFAKQGALFDDVTAAAPSTLAGHASLLTGRYAHTHGSARDGFPIHPQNPLLPKILGRNDYDTAAFVGSGALAVRRELRESFQTFGDDSLRQTVTGRVRSADRSGAPEVLAQAYEWLDRPREKPFFMFIQLTDPQFPFSPPERFADLYRFNEDPSRLAEWDHDDFALAQQQRFTPDARGRAGVMTRGLDRNLLIHPDGSQLEGEVALANLYAGAVSYIDDQLGQLFEELKRRNLWETSLIVVTSDHGETFWEHGDFWSHGLALYQTSVRVPLIMHGPGVSAGARISTPVSSVDVAPTLLDAARIVRPTSMEGTTLLPGARGQVFQRDPVFAEATFPVGRVEQVRGWINRGKAKVVRRGPWKLIWTPYLDFMELYNLDSDPGERLNLLLNPAPEHVQLRDELLTQVKRWSASARPLPSRWEWDPEPDAPVEVEPGDPPPIPLDPEDAAN